MWLRVFKGWVNNQIWKTMLTRKGITLHASALPSRIRASISHASHGKAQYMFMVLPLMSSTLAIQRAPNRMRHRRPRHVGDDESLVVHAGMAKCPLAICTH
jgi:hypothetical protein